MIAALLAAYKDAVNIAEHAGMLPVHHAALNGCVEVLKMIAEVDISNLSIVSPGEHGSVAHCAVENSRLDNLRYVHSIVPEILSSVNDNLESVLHHGWHCPEILRFLLRHCPSLSTAVDNTDKTVYDYTMKKEVFTDEKEEANVVYVRRLLLRAGASSRYPGDLERS